MVYVHAGASPRPEPSRPVARNLWYCLGAVLADEDPVAAARWFRKAAQSGDVWSQLRLGVLYSADTGEGDPVEAAYWLRQVADAGHMEAQRALADLHQLRGLSTDMQGHTRLALLDGDNARREIDLPTDELVAFALGVLRKFSPESLTPSLGD